VVNDVLAVAIAAAVALVLAVILGAPELVMRVFRPGAPFNADVNDRSPTAKNR